MTRLYDISRTITPTLAVWPGDTPFSAQQVLDKRAGASVNLFTLTLSAHTGSHADAPFHYAQDGAHPVALPLAPYIGPAHVATIARRQGGIVPADFAGHELSGMERLLVHTWVSDLPDERWPNAESSCWAWICHPWTALMTTRCPAITGCANMAS